MHLTHQARKAMLLGATLLALALSACGGSHAQATSSSTGSQAATATSTTTAADPQTTSTAKAAEKVPDVDISVTSPVKLRPVSSRYTCHGANIPLPLHWSRIPHGTVELDLFVFDTLPKHNKFDVAWAVTGLSPHSSGITNGRLPARAVVGRNSSGQNRYSLCPRGIAPPSAYTVLLYALPHKVSVKPGFDAESLVEGTLEHSVEHEGQLSLTVKTS
ncbi:MAG TPA: hypothetical protein VH081_12485 [Solirubrobacteraceae bacterium]|nr:hypothetical protein [Solirubrobacteraceae bacterium]